MKKKFRLMLGAAVAVAGLAMAPARPMRRPMACKVGDLTCNVASGWGFVFGSSKDLHCTFRGNGHPRALHRLDLQVRRRYRLHRRRRAGVGRVRALVRHARGRAARRLCRRHGQATVGVGVGANVLIGGLDKSIALQPLSVEGNKGLNVAAGIGSISLKSRRT